MSDTAESFEGRSKSVQPSHVNYLQTSTVPSYPVNKPENTTIIEGVKKMMEK